jgi:hypothetical protein
LLEAHVWGALLAVAGDSKKLAALLAERARALEPAHNEPTGFLTDNDKAIERLRVEEERLIDAYRGQVISLDHLKPQLKKIEAKRARLTTERKAFLQRQEGSRSPRLDSLDLDAIASRLKRAMARADFATRQRIVQVLLNSVTVYPDRAVVSGVLPLSGNIPDDPRLLRPSSAQASC